MKGKDGEKGVSYLIKKAQKGLTECEDFIDDVEEGLPFFSKA
jgi:hypothetical protein